MEEGRRAHELASLIRNLYKWAVMTVNKPERMGVLWTDLIRSFSRLPVLLCVCKNWVGNHQPNDVSSFFSPVFTKDAVMWLTYISEGI